MQDEACICKVRCTSYCWHWHFARWNEQDAAVSHETPRKEKTMSDKYLDGQLHSQILQDQRSGAISFLPADEPVGSKPSDAGEKARLLSEQICESVDRSTRHIKGIIGALREKLDRLEAVLDHRTTLIINDGLKKHFELAAQTLEFCDNAQQIIEDFHIPNGDDHAEADQ